MFDSEKIYTWQNLTVENVLQLYLFKDFVSLENISNISNCLRLDNRYRTKVKIDAVTFMSDGPGRYAREMPQSSIFESFFSFELNGNSESLNQLLLQRLQNRLQTSKTNFTLLEIFEAEHSRKWIDFDLCVFGMDVSSSDYDQRTMIFNPARFTLSNDTIFIFDGKNSYIENMRICPNYGYSNKFEFNLYKFDYPFLQMEIDKIGIGNTVEFEWVNIDSIIPISRFGYEDYKKSKEEFNKKYDKTIAWFDEFKVSIKMAQIAQANRLSLKNYDTKAIFKIVMFERELKPKEENYINELIKDGSIKTIIDLKQYLSAGKLAEFLRREKTPESIMKGVKEKLQKIK
jgi:hypothetical protein